jgi:hypothetical protein
MLMDRICVLGLAGILFGAALSFGQESASSPAVPPSGVSGQVHGPAPECNDNIWPTCQPECPRIWGDAEFLLWWFKSPPVNPPLVTQATNPADPTSGQIGSANTRILLGDQSYDAGTRYGARFTLGGWLDCDSTIGVEGNYLLITPRTVTQSVSTSGAVGSPTLAIPFFNVTAGAENALILAGPGGGPAFPGSATLSVANQLQGSEINFVTGLVRNENFTLVGLIGFRYLHFKEELDFGFTNSAAAVSHFFSAQDTFTGGNEFYAGQLGLRAEYQFGGFFVNATGKVALGTVEQSGDVSGASTAGNPTVPIPGFTFTNVPGGIFALATNSGHHYQSVFGVLPEADVKLGYNITRNIRAFVGYNFLYLNNVVRPGTLIDHNINPTQQPASTPAPFTLIGSAAPIFSFNSTSFWAQGIDFGLALRF